jgi:hypothetical protein
MRNLYLIPDLNSIVSEPGATRLFYFLLIRHIACPHEEIGTLDDIPYLNP